MTIKDVQPSRMLQQIRASDQPMRTFINLTKQRLHYNLDLLGAVTGNEGEGKSTLIWTLGDLFVDTMDSTFIAYRPLQYLKKAKHIRNNYPVPRILGFDEAVSGMHNRKSMHKANQKMNEFLMICRAWNFFHMAAFPRFGSMDVYIREHRAVVWIDIEEMGTAWLRIRDPKIPVGEDIHQARMAFPKACRITWDAVDTPEWREYEKNKDRFIEQFLNEALSELA